MALPTKAVADPSFKGPAAVETVLTKPFGLQRYPAWVSEVMAGAPEVPASEPELATPPRSGPLDGENAEPVPPNDQARSNGSSQAEQENGEKGGNSTNSGGDAPRPSKSRPPLPRPEGTVNCPRCTSAETKFCYYNNYNVKQPRYFCKVSGIQIPQPAGSQDSS